MNKVFIVGAPRSVTTWLQLLMAQDPQVATCQEALTECVVQIVPKHNELAMEQKNDIVQAFKKRLGQEVDILIQEVTEIQPEKSGKYRFVVSKVAT
jgi:hypothetical protein